MTAPDDFWEARRRERAHRDVANSRRVRPRGTVRFEPYVKVQWYDPTSLCWRDVQAQYRDEVDALLRCPLDAFPAKADWRLMHITTESRTPGDRRPPREVVS